MKAIVDTNVIAYYLLGTPEFGGEAQAFWRATDELLAPSSWEAELVNVVWMAVRTRTVTGVEGRVKLNLAARLGIRSVPARLLWHGALARALESGVPAYDALFVELADREQVPLATFDRKLLTSFPGLAKRPGEMRGAR
jgi:predicted nucleic acid-binding protein